MTDSSPIPDRFHFVWDDNFFPYGAYLAIKSVAVQCRPASIRLYKVPALDDVPNFRRLRDEVPCLEPMNIDLPAWLEEARLPCAGTLLEANRFLKERNYYGSVSDLLRTLRLYLDGGIYLDTDTITLRDLAPLRRQDAFLAEEHILVSSRAWKKTPWIYLRTSPLTLARDFCSRVPFGVAWFQAISRFFVRAVHNAVMGFRPGYPLMRDALMRMAEVYPRRPERYPLLGPDTLQDLIAEQSYPGLKVYPPRYFSPLGPTMTYQYFHRRRPKTIDAMCRRIVGDDTMLVHWSNNGTIAKIMPREDADLERLQGEQLFSRLALAAITHPGAVDALRAAG